MKKSFASLGLLDGKTGVGRTTSQMLARTGPDSVAWRICEANKQGKYAGAQDAVQGMIYPSIESSTDRSPSCFSRINDGSASDDLHIALWYLMNE